MQSMKHPLLISILTGCLLAILTFSGCSSGGSVTESDGDEPSTDGDTPDGDDDPIIDGDGEVELEGEDEQVVLPELIRECSQCHSYDALGEYRDPVLGSREWMVEAQGGLYRQDPVLPAPGVFLEVIWPERGYHDQEALDDCSVCHPVDELGIGHSVITYTGAAREAVFTGSQDCASACHPWQSESITTSGFENADGATPSHEGSKRAYDLLMAVDNAHSKIFKEGLRTEIADIRVGAFNPGCGSCHHLAKEQHGEIVTCAYCHDFGSMSSDLHTSHLNAIDGRVAQLDVAMIGITPCDYCHWQDEAWAERSNAACYNCHLSGHQPLDEDGQAHFWPLDSISADGDGEQE